MPVHLLVTRIHQLLCIYILRPTRCTLVIAIGAGEWDEDTINRVVDKATNAEGLLVQARDESLIALMINKQTILLAICLDRIPKFSKQRKVTQNPLVSKNIA